MKPLSLILIVCCSMVLSIGSHGFSQESRPQLSDLLNLLWAGDHTQVISLLEAEPDYATAYPNEVSVLTVVSLLKEDRYDDAVSAVTRFLKDEQLVLGDHLLTFLQEDSLEREKFAEAQIYFDRLYSEFPESPVLFYASMNIVKALKKAGDLTTARQFLEKALEFANDADDRLSAKHLLYEILLTQTHYPEAALLLRSLYLDYDSQTYTQTREMAAPLQGNLSPSDFSIEERLSLGQFFSQLGYREIALFLVEELDPASFAPNRQQELGVLLIQIAVNTDNLDRVEDIIGRIPLLEDTADALFYRGVVHQRRALHQQAIEHYQTLIDRYPSSGYLFNAYRNLAFSYQILGDESTYQKIMELMINAFPQRPDLLWDLFWYYYQRGETIQSRRWLERMTDFSAERNRALFWLARTSSSPEEKRSFIEQILAGNTIDYYFMRAWQEAPTLNLPTTLPPTFSPQAEYQPGLGTVATSLTWQRYTILYRLGYLARSALELTAYRRANPSRVEIWWELSELSARRGHYRRSILQALQLAARLPSSYRNIQKRIYPDFYFDLIKTVSEDQGIDPYLVLSVLRAESFFEYDAVSIAGAVGLMQIMPSTGAWMAERMSRKAGGEFIWDNSFLFDPAENITIGVTYLAYLINKYEGKICPAICAYNAGPGRVNSWLETLPRDRDEFVESIPFPETRNYIKRVLENYFYYSWLYRGEFTLNPCIF